MNLEVPDYVSRCLQLAILLEVSAYPKPGNVHRTRDFSDTRYEHFLASAVAVSPYFRKAAERGILYSSGNIDASEIGIGSLIRGSVEEILSWQHGGNTLLGTIILLIPMAVSAGATINTEKFFSQHVFRRNIGVVTKFTTPEDAVAVYEAIRKAKPGGLGKAPELDVHDPRSTTRILREKITLLEIFKIASRYDSVASEWVSNYRVTFEIGYPYIKRELSRHGDINIATVHTFLKILSEVPDTLIARKVGIEKAKEISLMAKHILELGGLLTGDGRRELDRFDRMLHDPEHLLNPGTTADLVSATLATLILSGYRP